MDDGRTALLPAIASLLLPSEPLMGPDRNSSSASAVPV